MTPLPPATPPYSLLNWPTSSPSDRVRLFPLRPLPPVFRLHGRPILRLLRLHQRSHRRHRYQHRPSQSRRAREQGLHLASSAAEPTTSASTYFGGENRIESSSGLQTAFIGFGTTGAPSTEVATLAAYLSPSPSIKWSKGTSALAAAIPEGASVQSVYLPYSDVSPLGLLVQAPTAEGVKQVGQAAVQALKKAAGVVSQEELASAVAKAKFAAASAGLVATIGSKIFSGSLCCVYSLDLRCRQRLCVHKTASSLVSLKLTYVAVGEVGSLPYAGELGL